MSKYMKMIDNYIYLYNVDKYIVLPTYPESISDHTAVTYTSDTPMSRSAPIYSYSNSGPRSMTITLNLHRDLMHDINLGTSNLDLSELPKGTDYVDYMIGCFHAMALPEYNASEKLVDPPLVAARFGKDIYIKGVITGSVEVSYGLPILSNGKYAVVNVNFTIEEVQPFSASDLVTQGGYRGIDTLVERNIWKR